MPKKYFLILFLTGCFLLPAGTSLAQTGQVQEINCSDYYTFNSVVFTNANAVTSRNDAGGKIDFSFSAINNNAYPIADGLVFAKIYRRNVSAPGNNFLIDQFVAVKNINLWSLEERGFNFSWISPENSVAGNYFADLFFISSRQFNLSGLSFTPTVIGTTANFDIQQGQTKGYWFDDTDVLFNGAEKIITSIPPTTNDGKSVSLSVHLISQLKSGEAKVTAKIYPFDVVKGEAGVITKYTQIKEGINLSKEDQIINFSFQNLEPGAYVAEIKAEGEKQQAMSDFRFAVTGKKGRMIFVGLDAFPLGKNRDFSIFSCFSNSADFYSTFNGKVSLELVDKATQKTLSQFSWQGKIVSSPVQGIKQNFKAQENSGDLLLISKLYDENNNLMDQTQTEYNLANFTKLPEAKTPVSWANIIKIAVIAAIIIILAVLIIFLIKRKKIKKINNFSSNLFSKINKNKNLKSFLIVTGIFVAGGITYAYFYPIKTFADFLPITATCRAYVDGKVSEYANLNEAVTFIVDNVMIGGIPAGETPVSYSFSDYGGLSCTQSPPEISPNCVFSSASKAVFQPTVTMATMNHDSGTVTCPKIIVTNNPPSSSSPLFIADPTYQPCLPQDGRSPYYLQVANLAITSSMNYVDLRSADGTLVSGDAGNPTDVCNQRVFNMSTSGNYHLDFIPVVGGYMDTPAVNWVRSYPQQGAADPFCPDTVTLGGTTYAITGPDAGINAYLYSQNVPGVVGTSNNCPKKSCLDPDNFWKGPNPLPNCPLAGGTVAGITIPAWTPDNFEQNCDLCAQIYDQNGGITTDSFFGLRNRIAKVQLVDPIWSKSMCAEIQLNCDRKLKVSVTGPAWITLTNPSTGDSCIACDPNDPGNKLNGGTACQSSCSFNDISGNLTYGTLTDNILLSASLRSPDGSEGISAVTFRTDYDCFLYLDRDYFLQKPVPPSTQSAGIGSEAGRFSFFLDSPASLGHYEKSFFINVKNCCQ